MIITNKTKTGEMFRPNDWAERICSLFATYRTDKRLQYCEKVRPMCDSTGNCCIFLDDSLRETDPETFMVIYNFAIENSLVIIGDT